MHCSSRLGRLRVGSVDASGRLLVNRVGSPFCAHLSSSDRVSSLEFESARVACHTLVVLVESALGPSGRLEYLCVLNNLGRAMIESALLSFESARVHKFRKLKIQLDYLAGLDSIRSNDFIDFFLSTYRSNP